MGGVYMNQVISKLNLNQLEKAKGFIDFLKLGVKFIMMLTLVAFGTFTAFILSSILFTLAGMFSTDTFLWAITWEIEGLLVCLVVLFALKYLLSGVKSLSLSVVNETKNHSRIDPQVVDIRFYTTRRDTTIIIK
jgi:hypothetical protein